MRKKINATITNRRKPSDFFGRIREVFSHKFDGFPAIPATPSGKKAADAAADVGEADQSKIIDEVSKLLQQNKIIPNVPCPDQDCGQRTTTNDTFDEGGLIAAWGSPSAEPGGEWVLLDIDSFNPVAFSGNRIDNVIRVVGSQNTLWWGGSAYLSNTSLPTTLTTFRIDFIISPLSPSSNTESSNELAVVMAATPTELNEFSGHAATFFWNKVAAFTPRSGYNIGAGNAEFTFVEGTRYSFKYQHNDSTGEIKTKFWTSSDEEPDWQVSSSEGGTDRATALAVTLSPIQWPTGTTGKENGVTLWAGYGPEVSPLLIVPADMPAGITCNNELTTTDHITYTPITKAKYYIDVYADGAPMIINIDYTVVNGNVVFNSQQSDDALVTARYVTA